MAPPPSQRCIAIQCGKVAQQLTRGGKQRGETVNDGLMGNVFRQGRLADSVGAEFE
jgi:hypothetical protein